jgi:hypothetical protein
MTGMRSHTDHQSPLDWWRRQIQRQPKTNLIIVDRALVFVRLISVPQIG